MVWSGPASAAGISFTLTFTSSEASQPLSDTVSVNRVVSVTDECGNATAFEYNHDGKMTRKTDSNGFVSEYFYDDFNRLVRAELPPVPGKTGKNIIRIKYDRNGNVKEITEGDGKITLRDYDKLNRITAETVKKGSGSSEVIL